MSTGPYEATSIKDVDIESLAEQFDYSTLRVGFDAAKDEHYGCLMGPHWEQYSIFKFDAHEDLDRVNHLLEGLPADEITAVIEPSGSYHEPLRKRLEEDGLEVVKMGTRKCTRAADLFDDVPSLHDGKSAYLLARLHILELTKQFRELSVRERKIRAILREMRSAEDAYNRLTGRMEGQLSRLWSELTKHLNLGSATLPRLIAAYGSAQAVAADPEGARKLLHDASRGNLGAERIHEVIESARETEGVEAIEREREEMQKLGEKMDAARREVRERSRELDAVIDEADQEGGEGAEQDSDEDADKPSSEIGRLRGFGGTKLAGALIAKMGAPSEYESASHYEKAAGLNLKERSSGKRQGELAITKRGPGEVRHYLFMLACRRVQAGARGCPYVRAWYQERLRRNGGNRLKGLVAVMRKLIGALYHIGRGDPYDPHKLFDVSRLDLPAPN